MSAAVEPIAPRFRRMWPDDIPEVVEIEQASYQFPWTPSVFRDCIRVGYFCLVLEIDRKIGGYCVMVAGAGEAHILNLCVNPTIRGRGFGRSSLNCLLQVARERSIDKMVLEVRPTNIHAIALYHSMGFEQIGVRRDYYQAREGREDAVVLALEL